MSYLLGYNIVSGFHFALVQRIWSKQLLMIFERRVVAIALWMGLLSICSDWVPLWHCWYSSAILFTCLIILVFENKNKLIWFNFIFTYFFIFKKNYQRFFYKLNLDYIQKYSFKPQSTQRQEITSFQIMPLTKIIFSR